MLSITQFLERAALINKHGVATICDDRRRTWGDVLFRVELAAGALQSLGLGADDKVAILAPNSDVYLEYLLSVNWAGGVTVPINTRLAVPEMVETLNDCQAKILVVSQDFVDKVSAIRDKIPAVNHLICIETFDRTGTTDLLFHEKLIESSSPVPNAGRYGDDIASLCYTGGTTGRSKGVILTHRGMANNVMQWIIGLGAVKEDRFMLVPPLFHAAGAATALAVVALAATACILPKFDIPRLMEAIERERLTSLPVVATMLDMLVNHTQVKEYDLSSLRMIAYGASPIHENILTRSLEVFPDVMLCQVYGQTEGGPTVSTLPPEYHVTEGPLAGKIKSAGIPVIGTSLLIVDEDNNPLPAGELGEICVRGPGVSPGYWQLPEVTSDTIRDGWLHTGDAGYLDADGFLYISDRIKDMIISGGENVYSVEVENVLLKHPSVRDCVVIGIPSKKWGEQVHAIVLLEPGTSVTKEQLVNHCREYLAGYKCIRSVEFRDEPFPVNAANKILKRELRKPYWRNSDK